MPRPRPLTPAEARRTLAHRLAPRVDRLRQFATRFGVRPYRVFLVWVTWDGARGERGSGSEREIPGGRFEILPTPKVENLDNVSYRFFSGGVLPVGSIRVTEISALLTQDQLRGLSIPTASFTEANDPPDARTALEVPAPANPRTLPEPFDFYWEVHEDGRGDEEPQHQKYRLSGLPFRDAGAVQWKVLLEKYGQDENRDGTLTNGFDP